MKRSSDPLHPFVIFQYTLQGSGTYVEKGQAHTVLPQQAFVTIVPSDSHYFLPAESEEWKFFWIQIRHSYMGSV